MERRSANQGIYKEREPSLQSHSAPTKRGMPRAIHLQIANSRRDFHHKLSTRIVREFDYIAVGNINAAGLAKTNMAKSVLDAGWSSFRSQLAYKAIRHGAWFEEVNESFTSQVCSCCGALPESRPKGIAGLGIRLWVCSDCGASHDRDVNAALNILRRGRATLAVGIPAL
jgi:putative transposase